MMKKKAVKVYYTYASLLEASSRNHHPVITRTTLATPTTTTTALVGPPSLARRLTETSKNMTTAFPSCGNACLDLFFHVKPPRYLTPSTPQYTQEYLKHLLPLAWSHDSLTTLKLICNLLDDKRDKQGFYTAAYWLYQHHPNTLACNVPLIANSFGRMSDILEVLYRALQGQDHVNQTTSTSEDDPDPDPLKVKITERRIGGRTSSSRRREKIFAMANKALERYRLDRDYRLLHDTVSDIYANCLKFDIQNLNNHVNKSKSSSESESNLKMTTQAFSCPDVNSCYDHATLLCESIAKKVFPRESEEEADYAFRVRRKLSKEVLLPLRKFLDRHSRTEFKRKPSAVRTYLEEVKAGGVGDIKAGALLPNEMIEFLADISCRQKHNNNDDVDVGLVAATELQWKTMVEDIYLKQGKFKNCLAVCDVSSLMSPKNMEVSVGFGVLLSQLSEEPWNGKVMTFPNPKLVSIRGHDLKSTYELMSTMKEEYDNGDLEIDFHKVFDLILQVAVDGKLKPEQMIKTVFVFTFCARNDGWESSDYEAVHNKFKEKGYGDVVPQVVFWKVYLACDYDAIEAPRTQPGMKTFCGFQTNNFVKSFLENDGDIVPDHVMESAISGDKYEYLVVVD